MVLIVGNYMNGLMAAATMLVLDDSTIPSVEKHRLCTRSLLVVTPTCSIPQLRMRIAIVPVDFCH